MNLDLAVVTCVSSDYLGYSRALIQSIRVVDPTTTIFVVVCDGDGRDYLHLHNVHCISGLELGVTNWKRVAFQYTAFELSCALKPFALREVLNQGFDSVVYVDSDVYFKSSPRLILQEFKKGDVILSPHVRRPVPDDGKIPQGEVFATHGVFNGGFMAIKNSQNSKQFLDWWGNACRKKCYIDVRGGVFVDQLCLNQAPIFFPGCVATLHAGINAAYWNLHERSIRFHGNMAFANEEPLVFFHFSGFEVDNEITLSRHQNRYRSSDSEGLQRLVREYKQLLDECGCKKKPEFNYAFETLSDGTRIRKTWREAIRLNYNELTSVEDPFSVEDNRKLKTIYRRAACRIALVREDWRANGVRFFLHRVASLPGVRCLWSRWVEYES